MAVSSTKPTKAASGMASLKRLRRFMRANSMITRPMARKPAAKMAMILAQV